MKFPVRCEIIDVEGQEVSPISKPHIGKQGLAEQIRNLEVEELGTFTTTTVRITLDDGNILAGYECWWKPIK